MVVRSGWNVYGAVKGELDLMGANFGLIWRKADGDRWLSAMSWWDGRQNAFFR